MVLRQRGAKAEETETGNVVAQPLEDDMGSGIGRQRGSEENEAAQNRAIGLLESRRFPGVRRHRVRAVASGIGKAEVEMQTGCSIGPSVQ